MGKVEDGWEKWNYADNCELRIEKEDWPLPEVTACSLP